MIYMLDKFGKHRKINITVYCHKKIDVSYICSIGGYYTEWPEECKPIKIGCQSKLADANDDLKPCNMTSPLLNIAMVG